ncbi:MAG TPA: protein kinase [Steroidobacteraceae bacterium]|nr:protein kinase [Steroidobacteraceae bacterium]
MLVVEDDVRYAEWLRHHLDVLCPRASVSMLNLAEFERWCTTFSGRDCDLLLLGCRFGSSPEDPNSPGLTLLRRLQNQPLAPAVIAIAEDGNELTAVRAMQLGALDYLPKKLLSPERLSTAVRVAMRRVERRVQRRLASLAHIEHDRVAHAAKSPPAETAGRVGDTVAGVVPPGAAPAAADNAPAAATGALQPPGVVALLTAPAGEDFIPGYTLRVKVGESEKAAVYLATSAVRGHNVALKVSKTLRDEAAGRQFLEREYTAVQAIKSPLVVEIYDYGVHAGFEYLAMEYLPRGDLKARIARGVSERESLQYLRHISEALQVVHQAGLVHRDLKPPNVMLRENDAVALIDFGLARQIEGSTSSLQTGQTGVLRGSPYYMSPEQALGDQLDGRSDFYSLGIIFYEMLTGQKPYTGGTALDVLQQHVSAPPPQLPEALARYQPLLTLLVAKSRNERFATAAEIINAADGLLASTIAEPQSSAA